MHRFFLGLIFGLTILACISNCNVKQDVPRFLGQLATKESPKVVLITLDGVRWQEVFNGTDRTLRTGESLAPEEMMPNLYRYFVSRGSS